MSDPKEFRYDAVARDFDELLTKELADNAPEPTSEKTSNEDCDGGLKRVAHGKTPLEEVRSVIKQRDKSASQEITEHSVRSRLRKLAAEQQERLDSFIQRAKS